MEAPKIYCAVAGAGQQEERGGLPGTERCNRTTTSYRDVVKLKSFLPRVLFRDNIALEADLNKHYEYLSREKRRALAYWKHVQSVFISTQIRKRQRANQRGHNCTKLPSIATNNYTTGGYGSYR